MKSLLLFFLVSCFLFLFTPSPAFAVTCPTGYTPYVISCVNDGVIGFCTGLANGLCGTPICGTNGKAVVAYTCIGAAITAGNTANLKNNPVPFCTSLINTVGLGSYTSLITACSGLVSSLIGLLPAQFTTKPLDTPGPSPWCSGDQSVIRTGLGCINASGKGAISTILAWAIGIAGGFAILLVVYAAGQIVTAGGDVKRVQSGRQLLSAALVGLFLISLAVALLNFIGVKILALPTFNY